MQGFGQGAARQLTKDCDIDQLVVLRSGDCGSLRKGGILHSTRIAILLLVELRLMYEGFDPREHVGLLLAIIDRVQHREVPVDFQGILEDRHGDISHHAVEHKEVADA